MSIFFASSSSVGIPIGKSLIDAGLVDGFISNPDKPVGRNREILPNEFAIWASSTSIPIHKPTSNEELLKIIRESEVVVTCAYGLMINEELLTVPKLGWLNIHFSMLPNYRGAAPVQRSIQKGDTESGFSIFKMDKGLDTGELLFQEKYPIAPQIKASELLLKLSELAGAKLPQLLQQRDDWKFSKQIGDVSTAPKIDKSENRINWGEDAMRIFNNFRALDFNGGVHTFFRGEKIEILEMQIADTKSDPGMIQSKDHVLLVGSGSNSLEISELKPAGKKAMKVRDWLNGARVAVGEKFE
jgi:methionyl-tRNA formyltransferase